MKTDNKPTVWPYVQYMLLMLIVCAMILLAHYLGLIEVSAKSGIE